MHHALRRAGVSDCNLVKVSSVIPPGCRIISWREGVRLLRPGNIIYSVLAMSETNEPHQRVSVGLGWAISSKEGVPGYIAEIEEEEAKGKSAKSAADEVGQMALTLLAEKLRAKINAERLWARSKRTHRIGGTVVNCGCVTATVVGDERKRYLSAVALAVYL
jgi:arginine decarboxylase